MPSFRRRASVTDAAKKPEDAVDPAQALSLAEEAEAEAAEAEAIAAAARARAKAIRLRREAQAAETNTVNGAAAEVETTPADIEAATAKTEAAPEAEDVPDGELASDGDTVETETSDLGESADEPDEGAEAVGAKGRRWGLVLTVVAMTLAILATAALITASVLMFVHNRNTVDQQKLNAEYAAAGRQSVVTLMSLDFNKAQEDVQRIIDNATGQFKTDFQNQAADFIKVAQDSKVVTDVTVNSTAVESMDEKTAVVLVAATSRVSNSAGAKQEPRAWRLAVNLERDNGQIKMAKVEFVP